MTTEIEGISLYTCDFLAVVDVGSITANKSELPGQQLTLFFLTKLLQVL